MTPLSRSFVRRFLFLLLTLLVALVSVRAAQADRGLGEVKEPGTPSALVVQDLTGPLTADDLADALLGAGVTISNVTYTGADVAAGSFTGGDGIIGFNDGIILTSGAVANVVGPNQSDSISTANGTPGDADLDALSGFTTLDAAILEFDFVPTSTTLFFRYVFASDEYNEFVNTQFNDVFAFFINGVNCATVGGDPVTINTINNGNPYNTPPMSHPELYINNDLDDGGGAIDTEMDGLTVVLTCGANVNANQTNTMKLAIADASDEIYDSAVFIEAGSLTTVPSAVSFSGLSGAGVSAAPLWIAAAALMVACLALLWRRRLVRPG